MTASDLRHLRLSLAAFAGLTAIGLGIAFAARHLAYRQAEFHRAALAERGETEARLAQASREAAAVPRRMALYQALAAHGSQEDRAAWLARLAHLKTRLDIEALRYELAPRGPLQGSALPEAGAASFMASALKLQMRLRHEDQLMNFLAALEREVPAFLRVRTCSITRGDGGLDAECTADWITLREQP